jgi:hypothetical protein
MHRSDDGLNGARGCLVGFAIVVVFAAIVAVLVVVL